MLKPAQKKSVGHHSPSVLLGRFNALKFVSSFWFMRPWTAASAFLLIILSVAFDLAIPGISGHLVQALTVMPHQPGQAFQIWSAFVLLTVLFHVARHGGLFFWNPLAAKSMADAVNLGFKKLQYLASDWHSENFAGATVRKLSRGMWGYDMASDAIIVSLVPAFLFLLGLTILMGSRWPVAGAFIAVVATAYVASNLYLNARWIENSHVRSRLYDAELNAAFVDAITSNATVKAFAAETHEEKRTSAIAEAWRKAAAQTTSRFNYFGFIHNFILVALQAGLTGIVLLRWSKGAATVGDLAFVLAATGLMSGYLRNIGDQIRLAQRGLGDVKDLADLASMQPEVSDTLNSQSLDAGSGNIDFDDVSFGYKGSQSPVFTNLSLKIKAGECIALVGETGAGKSTFVKLLQRLHDVNGGSIRINGQDVRYVTLKSLRQAIASVPQDPVLFHRSIEENICYSRPEATKNEIREAASRARAHEFISSLPQQYDTLVGERGVKLSGGERQRIAIARAFLSSAPILVFDEATSSLDVKTEEAIQAALEDLRFDRTTIIIAHRLSTIRNADRILVFDNGRIVEDGGHFDLIERNGLYSEMHSIIVGNQNVV